ncbi:MAG: hypothetical protein IJZ23_08415 [Roseburia sp.]|nr:hypothetical protein [Roseburia sp.]
MNIFGIEIGGLQIIFILVMILCALFLAREMRTWYWKINDIILNQDEQLKLMDKMINELSNQNKKLLTIIKEIRHENDESTPI